MFISLPMIPWSAFPGTFSWACAICVSARVVFKWLWYDWTGIYLAGNLHTTGQWTWPSNWLLFVISRAQNNGIQYFSVDQPCKEHLAELSAILCRYFYTSITDHIRGRSGVSESHEVAFLCTKLNTAKWSHLKHYRLVKKGVQVPLGLYLFKIYSIEYFKFLKICIV